LLEFLELKTLLSACEFNFDFLLLVDFWLIEIDIECLWVVYFNI